MLFTIASVAAAQPYELQATTKGMPNNTRIYLKDAESDTLLHTAIVQNGSFAIQGSLQAALMRVVLHTEGFKQYKIFWLQQGTTKLTMESNTLRNATISGGSVTADEAKLSAWILPFEKRQESLEAAIEREKDETKRQKLIKEYETLSEQEAATTRRFVREHPSSLYSAYILNVYSATWGVDTTRLLFSLLAPELQETSFGKETNRYLTLSKNLPVGSQFADVSAPDTSGVMQSLSNLRGKWVLLEFWASWCGPCREENPTLLKNYQLLSGKNFEIFAVSLDKNAADWKKAIRKDNLPWIHASQLRGFKDDAALTYSISGIPDNVLINPEGRIVAKNLRGDDLLQWIN